MFSLEVDNYRALRRVRCVFQPGITVLAAPNGTGKTTLLDVPMLMRDAATHGLVEALDHHGGRAARTWDVTGEDVRILLGIGDLKWEIAFANESAQVADLREQLWIDDEPAPYATLGLSDTFLRVGSETLGFASGGPVAFGAAEQRLPDHALDFQRVRGCRAYTDFAIRTLKAHGSEYGGDHFLHPTGRNVFTVLRNWRDRQATRALHDFVVDGMRAAFPAFRGFEFEAAGQIVVGSFSMASTEEVRQEPLRVSANGMVAAMLHLAAVASAPTGGYVGLDEPENALHPFALRALLDAIEDRAADCGVAVVVSTHSPVVLDHFQGRAERILVRQLDAENGAGFAPLSQIETPEYLNDFALGQLYTQGHFGAPAR